MKYGDSVPIVRVEWLIDSLLLAVRMPEIDYQVRSFMKEGYAHSHIQANNHNSLSTVALLSSSSMNKHLPPSPASKSISISLQNSQ